MRNTTHIIKEKLPIVDVVRTYIELIPAGKYYKARCPFHGERTPSFVVSPERDTFHCFGCGKGGDIFAFVEAIEGVSFKEALSTLAERAGVSITSSSAQQEPVSVLRSILEAARLFYVEQRTDSVYTYLEKRGVSRESMERFSIGYAPDAWRSLTDHLRTLGFSDEDIVSSGLAVKSQKGIYDRFRGRIMFPITDNQGYTIAFTGRIAPDSSITIGADPAKYVNSPETALFHKSSVLYGYAAAKQAIRTSGRALLMEGQMDVIMAHQVGNEEAVALSGTALTETQLRLLGRFTQSLVFALDRDSAGQKALERGAALALAQGFDVQVVVIPPPFDPADLIATDSLQWKHTVEHPEPLIIFLLNQLQEESKGDVRSFRLLVQKRLLPLVQKIENIIDRTHFLTVIAGKTLLPLEVLQEALGTTEKPTMVPTVKTTPSLYALLKWQYGITQPAFSIEMLLEKAKKYGIDVSEKLALVKPEHALEAEVFYANSDALEGIAFDLLYQEIISSLEEQREAVTRALSSTHSDTDEYQQLLRRLSDIVQHISVVKQERSKV